MMENGKLKAGKTYPMEDGMGIIELMVSMAIGLVLIAALGSIFLTNSRTSRLQEDQSRLQETSLAALDALAYHLRLAGFVDLSNDTSRIVALVNPANIPWLKKQDTPHTKDMLNVFFGQNPPYVGIKALLGCDGPFNTAASGALPVTCSNTPGPDSISVAYQVQPTVVGGTAVRATITPLDTLSYNPATGQGVDCAGQDVNGPSANPQGPLAVNFFYIDTANNRLMCVGNGDPSKARSVAEGVEYMRLRYGITPATLGQGPMDSFVGQYVAAADVPDWSRVLSVRVCLQIASPSANVANELTSYVDCDGATHSQTDGKIRKTFNATITLRNNVLTNPDALP